MSRPRSRWSGNSGRVGTVGYCWGGTLSYLAAVQLPVACAVVYYGRVSGLPGAEAALPGACTTTARRTRASRRPTWSRRAPTAQATRRWCIVYEGAGHGFNCDQRDSYDPQAAALARTRTLEFLARYVAGQPAADGMTSRNRSHETA